MSDTMTYASLSASATGDSNRTAAERHPYLNPQLHEHETVAHRTGDAKKYLTTVADRLQAEGLSASFDTHRGTPGPVIVEEAAGTLIAMGGHGRFGVSRCWLGSVADRILHLTSNPFLIVRSHQQDDLLHQEGFNRIVVPVDGSSIAEQILPPGGVSSFRARLGGRTSEGHAFEGRFPPASTSHSGSSQPVL